MSLVVDASMAIAWLFTDERGPAPEVVLGRVVREGAIVPSLWRLEVANVLRNAVRRRRCDEGYATRSLERLGRLRIAVDAETDSHAWGATRRLSLQHGLTLYDAAYLELAVRRKLPLASCDAQLLKAARKAQLEVMGV